MRQITDAHVGNTFWVQDRTSPTPSAGTPVVIRDSSPTTDRWDYAAVEVDPGSKVSSQAVSTTSTTADPPATTSTTADPPATTSTTADPPATTSTTANPPATTSTTANVGQPPLNGGSGAATGLCGLAQPALCGTFDAPAGIGNRSGQLNGTLWGVSRLSGAQNFSSPANGWSATQLNDCGNTSTVFAPNDVVICNGQLHDSVTDGGNVTALAMYPKQPFDFANRTGKIVFDVSNDTQGSHAAWPELWVTDQPVPAPFAHESTLQSNPRNGFGLRFAGCNGNGCGDGSNFFSVDSAIAVSNYVENDSFSGGNLTVNDVGDVSKSGPGQMNHVEVDVSQGQIDVYATNAFTPGGTVPPLVHIAQIPNAGLTFTRGILWIEDAHYNGDKFNSQGTHTFTWDNVGFDGPVLPRDLAFDVADNPNGGGDLGYFIGSNSSLGVVDHGLYNVANASGALLTFNYYTQTAPVTFQYAINGHQHTLAWSNANAYSPGTMAISIPLSDVVTGDNTITFSTGGAPMTFMNIDLIMVGAGGVVGP